MSWRSRRTIVPTICVSFLLALVTVQCGGDGAGVLATPTTTSTTAAEENRIPFEQAVELVLNQVVKPDDLDHQVIVFSLPEALQPGNKIGPYHTEDFSDHEEPTQIQEETWFFWIDDAPGARFMHPTRFVFVAREGGLLSVTETEEQWWPVLNGEGLWTKSEAYWDEANWIYSNVDWRPSQSEQSAIKVRGAAPEVLAGIPKQDGPEIGSALVINGWYGGDPNTEADDESGKEDMEADADGMHDVLTEAGFDVTYLGPPEDDNPDRDGENELFTRNEWFSKKAQEMKPSQTLYVYVVGHGNMLPDGDGVIDGIYESLLNKHNLSQFDPGVHIIIVLDSCHSGSFTDSLMDVADVTLTATNAYMPSWNDIDPPNDPDPEDTGGEYTSAFVKSLREILADPAKREQAQQQAQSQGTNFWEEASWMAHQGASRYDSSAKNALSFPQAVRGLPSTKPVTQITPEDVQAASEAFENKFNGAYLDENPDPLIEILDPAVIDLFGLLQCQGYLGSVINTPTSIDIVNIEKLSEPWVWEINGHSEKIDGVYLAEVDISVGDQTIRQEIHLKLYSDGSNIWFTWFTNCGEPLAVDDADVEILVDLDAAKDIILENIDELVPTADDGNVIVFNPIYIGSGDMLQPYFGPDLVSPGEVLPYHGWFSWGDLSANAWFAHPTLYIFVDPMTGEISTSVNNWWPVVNGEGLWVNTTDYWDDTNWLYWTNIDPAWHTSSQEEAILADIATSQYLPEGNPGAALVVNGWTYPQINERDSQRNADGMTGALSFAGFDPAYLGPQAWFDKYDIYYWIEDQSKILQPGQTATIYIAGHGANRDGNGLISVGGDLLYEEDLVDWLTMFDPGVNLLIILDGCYSGSFIDGLSEVGPNIHVYTSADAEHCSFNDLDPYPPTPYSEKNDPNPNDLGSEFTSGIVEGIYTILSDQEQSERVGLLAGLNNESFPQTLLREAWYYSGKNNVNYLRGYENPQAYPPIEGFTTADSQVSVPVEETHGTTDNTNDGASCTTGDNISADLEPIIDITNANAAIIYEGGQCYYAFNIQVLQPPTSEVWGGFRFDDPHGNILNQPCPDFYYNNFGNHSLDFLYDPATGELFLVFQYISQDGSGWSIAEDLAFTGSVDGNTITGLAPCDFMSEFSPETNWFAFTTDKDFNHCDAAGLEGGEPSLSLPPKQD